MFPENTLYSFVSLHMNESLLICAWHSCDLSKSLSEKNIKVGIRLLYPRYSCVSDSQIKTGTALFHDKIQNHFL